MLICNFSLYFPLWFRGRDFGSDCISVWSLCLLILTDLDQDYNKKIEINQHLVKNTGNISRGSCKSGKQTSAHARVCVQDLQDPREIVPVFLTKGRLIYI